MDLREEERESVDSIQHTLQKNPMADVNEYNEEFQSSIKAVTYRRKTRDDESRKASS
jgi:hypothetical protein